MQTVFVIDDDEMYQMVLKRNLGKLGLELDLISFWHGQEAIDAINDIFIHNKTLPDLILLDLNMPVLDGWQFLEELEKINTGNRKLPPVYMLTTSIDEHDKDKASTYKNICGFLVKPIPKEALEMIFSLL